MHYLDVSGAIKNCNRTDGSTNLKILVTLFMYDPYCEYFSSAVASEGSSLKTCSFSHDKYNFKQSTLSTLTFVKCFPSAFSVEHFWGYNISYLFSTLSLLLMFRCHQQKKYLFMFFNFNV